MIVCVCTSAFHVHAQRTWHAQSHTVHCAHACVYACTHEDVRRAVILADETISSGTKGNIVMNNYLSAVESVSIEESSLKIPHTSYEIRLASMQSLINMILSHDKF